MLSFRTNGNFIDFVNTDDTSLNVETVLMTLHNTSKCIDWSYDEDTTRITFTIDETKYSNILIGDIDFDGVTMTVQADFKTNIEEMFPGLAGGSEGVLLLSTVELTNAQIKALPTTPVNIVDRPGAGKLIQPLQVIMWLNTAGGAYTNLATEAYLTPTYEDDFEWATYMIQSAAGE